MSFQAYLDNIQKKTGKSPDQFRTLSKRKGLSSYSEIFSWLTSEHGLGHGHANAMAHVILGTHIDRSSQEDKVSRHFKGAKESWRKTFDGLMGKVSGFGSDVSLAPTSSYISVVRGKAKFAVVQVTTEVMSIGIKLKGIPATARFQESGRWNAMVTHRARITKPKDINAELLDWLRKAYANAG
ncbi:MAG TPA: DUF4287 domain-containing protein [Spirochaetia bacterium]|nr:DUF4287 domain-containing protein [Spirochaetia bacterium]